LKPSINTKELCKQIRYSAKRGSLIWTKEEKQDFITNRHFLVRFEDIPNEVLASLFSVFFKLPIVGETLYAQFGDITKPVKPVNIGGVFRTDEQNVIGNVTEYVRDSGNKITSRVIKFPTHYSFINSEYMKLVEFDDLSPITSGNSSAAPVYFADKNLILLPYRFSGKEILIEDLLGAELGEGTNH
jgi:hypothetical protein